MQTAESIGRPLLGGAAAPVIMLLVAAAAVAFEAPTPLGELIGSADVVVVGTIEEVDEAGVRVAVEEVLAGELEAEAILVERFPAPAESPRWAPYAAGQSVVLFLERRCTRGDRRADWTIMGRIGEGEIPLEGEFAFLHGRYIDLQELPQGYYEFHGQTSYLQRLPREVLLDAVRTYRECWDWGSLPAEGGAPLACCSPEARREFAGRSLLHAFLASESAGPVPRQ